MQNGIKAIETSYNGYRFRSRLEARWAVYFDAVGIKYEYEKEGFELAGAGQYLPDFWLSQVKMFAEVKPDALSPEEWRKCKTLADVSGYEVLLLVGAPDFKEYYALRPDCNIMMDEPFEWPYTLCAEYLNDENRFFAASCCEKEEEFTSCWPEMKTGVYSARQARFEHGEKPKF